MCSVGVHLDMTLNPMEEIRFKTRNSKLLKQLVKKLPFSQQELECIFLIYYKLQKVGGEHHNAVLKSTVADFLHAAFDMTDKKIVERVFCVFFKAPGIYVYLQDFVNMIALFLRGTFEDKLVYCYKCYTAYSFDGRITREIMFNQMHNSVLTPIKDEDSDDVVRDLLEILQKKMDIDRDLKVGFEDYEYCVSREHMLMECFGQCLPSRAAIHTFLTTFTEFRNKY